jgi:hypothetical protein
VVLLGDPASLPRRIQVAHMARDDLRDQRLVLGVPAVLLGMEDGLAMHHPAHVTRARIAQQPRRPTYAKNASIRPIASTRRFCSAPDSRASISMTLARQQTVALKPAMIRLRYPA